MSTLRAANAQTPLKVLQLLLDGIDKVSGGIIIIVMMVMIVVVSAQVFMRYVLNLSFNWADELSRLCFVWTIFLAIPLALKRGGHIVMELVLERVGSRTRDILYRMMAVPAALMLILVTWEASKAAVENWADVIPTLGWSGGLYFLPVAAGCGHATLHLVNILFVGEPQQQGIIE